MQNKTFINSNEVCQYVASIYQKSIIIHIHRNINKGQCNFKSANYIIELLENMEDWDQMILGCYTCGAKTTFEDLARANKILYRTKL